MQKILKSLLTPIAVSIAQLGITGTLLGMGYVTALPSAAAKESIVNRGFVLPSGNIYCLMITTERNFLRCEIRSRLNPIPREPYPGYCQFDWGHGFLLPDRGKPKVLCISDTIFGNYPILNYNFTWKQGGFKCTSRTTGLTCTNASGRGFFLSKEKWRTF